MTLERDIIIKFNGPFGRREVIFNTLYEFRLVNPKTTAGIALAIQKWAGANLHYPFDINKPHS